MSAEVTRLLVGKDPTDIQVFGLDVATALAGDGDSTISGVTSVTATAGVTADNETFSGSIVYARLTGGTIPEGFGPSINCRVTWTFTTSAGSTLQRSLDIPICQR